MGIARGPNLIKDNLVFGYDTGYGVADNSTATRFYPGENTTNFVTTNLETLGTDGSGQSSIGTRTTIAPNHVRIVDVASNTRQSHLISGLTASTIYTVSIQFKKITGTPTFRFQLQGYSGSSYVNTIKFTSTAETGLEDIEGWQTAEWTFTLPSNCNALRIWWQDGADYTTYTHSFELKNPQLEAKSHVTPYVSGTRSSTASLIDLKRTADIDVSNVSFDSTGQPTFDGTDDRISMGDTSFTDFGTGNFTIEAVLYIPSDITTSTGHYKGVVVKKGASSANAGMGIYYNTGHQKFLWSTADGTSGVERFTTNTFGNLLGTYIHVIMVRDSNTTNNGHFYINGVQEAISSGGSLMDVNNNYNLLVGASSTLYSLYYLEGEIPVAKIYSKALTATEAKQNFNAYKNRFNI
tara:strand:+ start:67 stop:1290 length:1224 start_codon:yes stop_codon:yes gene_type:complete